MRVNNVRIVRAELTPLSLSIDVVFVSEVQVYHWFRLLFSLLSLYDSPDAAAILWLDGFSTAGETR